MSDLNKIAKKFKIDGTIEEIKAFGSGHINDTYRVKIKEADKKDYILQVINHNIFPNVPELTKNIIRVTEHVKKKIEEKGGDPERETLTIIPTVEGEGFYKDEDGKYWRVFIFIDNTNSYDRLENAEQAYEGGKAFGNFLKMVADMPGGPLYEVIPGFHYTPNRIKTFLESVKKDPVNRVSQCKEEVEFLSARTEEMKKIVQMGEAGELPLRTTHNDTKFNNVLLDKNDKGLCVIDLDTVMPGYIMYDFGDAMRTSTNTGDEDDPNLDRVSMNIDLFEGFTKGFVSELKDTLTKNEIDNLAFGAKLLTYEQSVRFLTDYIDGDIYYKTAHKEHNLQRTRAQIKLLKSMEEQFDKMEAIVQEVANS